MISMDIITVFLTKLYDSQKQKNAKTAAIVSTSILVLWVLFSSLLSIPEVVSFLSPTILMVLKYIIDILALGKIIVTGARTSEDMKKLEEAPVNKEIDMPTNETTTIMESSETSSPTIASPVQALLHTHTKMQ